MSMPAKALMVLSATCLAFTAQAHSFLDHADPKVGSTLQSAPAEVKVWFTQALEPAFSTLEVVDAGGKPVTAAPARVDSRDKSLLRVAVSKLEPGEYTVVWRILSVDTHVTQGRFAFRVSR